MFIRWAGPMSSFHATARRFVVSLVFISFAVQLMGCSGDRFAHRGRALEPPNGAVTPASAEVVQVPPKAKSRVAQRRPGARLWGMLRRGGHATEEGTKKAARFAGMAAAWTALASAAGALFCLEEFGQSDDPMANAL